MKADPSTQLRLLDLQELDSRADRLRHQRVTMPEIHRAAEVDEQRRVSDDARRDAQILVDDLTAEQKRADADVEQVKARRERDRQRMESGAVSNPKDLERMQQEMASLERRISALEDDELEVMERLEEAQAELATHAQQVAEHDEELSALRARRRESEAEIDAELAEVAAKRSPLAAEMPAELLALYDRLRESKAGVGAAALRARRCSGCQLALDAAEIADIRAALADDVRRCEECQRILVRTADSGV